MKRLTRTVQSLSARVATAVVVLALLLPTFASLGAFALTNPFANLSKPSLPPPGEAWPPPAWLTGDVSSLGILELAYLAQGVSPTSAQAAQVKADLAALADLPPHYATIARTTLEGLAMYHWHRQQALAALSPQEIELVAALKPNDAPSSQAEEALGRVETRHLVLAANALLKASQSIRARLEDPTSIGLAQLTAEGLGASGSGLFPFAPGLGPGPLGRETVAALIAGTSPNPTPETEDQILGSLDGVPDEVVSALGAIVLTTLELSQADPAHATSAAVRVAEAIDQARRPLTLWSNLLLAERIFSPALYNTHLPDPDGPVRLAWGVPSIPPDAAPNPTVSDLIVDIAAFFGVPIPELDADLAAARIESELPLASQKPLQDLLAALLAYLQAGQRASATHPPPGFSNETLEVWSELLSEAALPAAGSADAEGLEAATGFLTAQGDVTFALSQLLGAAEEFLGSAARPMSSSASTSACADPPIIVEFVLAIDPCGAANIWTEDTIMLVDAGGDDQYNQRAGAPFLPVSALGPINQGVPVSFVFDLGGSDTYDSDRRDCSQGAACTSIHDADWGRNVVAAMNPVAILVDWQDVGATAKNVFVAGARSQGYGGSDTYANILLTSDADVSSPGRLYQRGYGVLIEHAGPGSSVDSSYDAGLLSQGVNVPFFDVGSQSQPPLYPTEDRGRSGIGALIRTVGSGSNSSAKFQAGDESQGVSARTGVGPIFAALINVAGSDAVANDEYRAGNVSQGGISIEGDSTTGGNVMRFTRPPVVGPAGILVDLAGPRSASHDYYEAGPRQTRGFGNRTLPLPGLLQDAGQPDDPVGVGIFLDGVLPDDAPQGADGSTGQSGSEPGPRIEWRWRGSDDEYVGGKDEMDNYGVGTRGYFFDLAGNDTYDSDAKQWGPSNTASWNQGHGVDTTASDDDQDGFLSSAEQAWNILGLPWSADPADESSSPASALPPTDHIIDPSGTQPTLRGRHGFVLAGIGPTTYAQDFSAAIQIDLDGADQYLGRTGAAGRVATLPGQPRFDQEHFSVFVDLRGNDLYAATFGQTHGYGGPGAIPGHGGKGLQFDLGGDDAFTAGAKSQGAAESAGAIGLLLDLNAENGPTTGRNTFAATTQSQGFGANQGIGAMVVVGGNNQFRAESGQGTGEQGHGFLVGIAAHNSYDDGVRPGGPTLSVLSGLSANLGNNQPPTIATTTFRLNGQAVEGVPIVHVNELVGFAVGAMDPDGDPLTICWTFEEGAADEPIESTTCGAEVQGAQTAPHHLTHQWTNVPTVAGSGFDRQIPYNVTVAATDSGGASSQPFVIPILVQNLPPPIAPPALGPTTVSSGQTAAYQLPIVYTPEQDAEAMNGHYVAAWGDGTTTTTTEEPLNWASSMLGALARVPDSVFTTGPNGEYVSRRLLPLVQPPSIALPFAIDGDLVKRAGFTYTPGETAPVHLYVDLPGPRQVQAIDIVASTTGKPFDFSLEGIQLDGTLVPIGEFTVQQRFSNNQMDYEAATTTFGHETEPLRSFPKLQGIVLRQLTEANANAQSFQQTVFIHEVRVLGPGIAHRWDAVGTFNALLERVDPNSGRNGTSFTVNVQAPLNAPPGLPGTFVGVNGQGPLRQVSVPLEQATVFEVRDVFGQSGSQYCLIWENGPEQCQDWEASGQPFTFTKQWATAGTYTVSARYDEPGRSIGPFPITIVHVHRALQVSNLLYLALDEDDDEPTWHVDRQFQAVIDANGDDLYFDGFASVLGNPLLLVDANGDDTYVSRLGGTQGYGAPTNASVWTDLDGDDVYVSAGNGQGFGFRLGSGFLIDLDGRNAFNPVPASDPLILDGSPLSFAPWNALSGARPSELLGPRAAFTPSPAANLQGAAVEGLGVLFLSGTYNHLVAGARSQGYAASGVVSSHAEQFTPGPPGCPPLITGSVAPGSPNPLAANPAALLCMLAIDWPQFPTVVCPTPPGQPLPRVCPQAGELTRWARDGPKPALNLGLLWIDDGPAALQGDEWSQAAAQKGGRAALVARGGALVASATEKAQSYAEDAHAWLHIGGNHTLRIAKDGQSRTLDTPTDPAAPQGAENPTALYTSTNDDDNLCIQGCGQATASHEPAGRPGPILRWEAGDVDPGTQTIQTWRNPAVKFGIKIEPDAGPANMAEVIVVSQTFGAAGLSGCTGAPLAGPLLVAHETGLAPDVVRTYGLPLEGSVPDGPASPAGCHEIRAYARYGATSGAGEPESSQWTRLIGRFRYMPPPQPILVGPDGAIMPMLASSGQPRSATMLLQEPYLLNSDEGQNVAYSLVAQNKTSGVTFELTTEPLAPWASSAMGPKQPVGISPPPVPGSYDLFSRANWPGVPLSDAPLHLVGTYDFDLIPPIVVVDVPASEWAPKPDGLLDPTEIRLTGTIRDTGVGLPANPVAVRLLSLPCESATKDDCVVNHLVFGSDLVPSSVATVGPASPQGVTPWTAILEVPFAYPGGRLVPQINATDAGGSYTGWTDFSVFQTGPQTKDSIAIDRAAPEPLGVLTSLATSSTSQTFADGAIEFTLTLVDCAKVRNSAQEPCEAGVGNNDERLQIMIRDFARSRLIPMRPTTLTPPDPQTKIQTATFEWTAPPGTPLDESPPPGRYEILVEAEDALGNFVSYNPGLSLFFDRTAPTIDAASIRLEPADGNAWVSPGDIVHVSVKVADLGVDASGIAVAEASLGSSTATLTMDSFAREYRGDLLIPAGLPDLQEATVQIVAIDAATNPTTAQSPNPLFFSAHEPTISGYHETKRADSVILGFVTDRLAHVESAVLVIGETELAGEEFRPNTLPVAGLSHTLKFEDLIPDAHYTLEILLRDPSGSESSLVRDIHTPALRNTNLVLDPIPDTPRSGVISIRGNLSLPAASKIELRTGSESGAILAETDFVPPPAAAKAPFQVEFNTRNMANSLIDATTNTFVIVVDDGIQRVSQAFQITLDNAKPRLKPQIDGPLANNGWYNRSINVEAAVEDLSLPLGLRIRLDEQAWADGRFVRLEQEGNHVVEFEASDGADPPNMARTSAQVRIDRTAPTLLAKLEPLVSPGADLHWNVTSSDNLSGLDGFQVLIGSTENAEWQPEPPANMSLSDVPEGEYWVTLKVRDVAGNVAQRAHNVFVDRSPPEILYADWIGVDQNGTPVLRLLSQDILPGGARGSGVTTLKVDDGTRITSIPSDGFSSLPLRVPEGSKGLTLQLLDAAGNAGPQKLLPPPPTGNRSTASEAQAPSSELFDHAAFAPREGTPSTSFLVSVVVRPWNGTGPDRVWASHGDERTELVPRGPPLADGSRHYAAALQFEASRAYAKSRVVIHASFGDQAVASPEIAGPLVFADPFENPPEGAQLKEEKSTPWPPAPAILAVILAVILVAILAAGLLRRRKRPRSIEVRQ